MTLTIPSLDIEMPVTDVGVAETGQMELPVDPAVAGWYRYGADAASAAGRILIAAHVDAPDYPIGPLARLRDVPVGESISITAADGSSREFVVESLTYYEKAALPTDELFQRGGPSALVLVTCGGPFDSRSGHYRDNVVAVAIPR
nr:class F sortase [Microbacterium hydrocarbonoxydans]